MSDTHQHQAGSDEALKAAAAMKLGFYSCASPGQLRLDVLESVLVVLHTEFHTNSLIAFMMTMSEIRRLAVSIDEAGLNPVYSPTFAASSALYGKALPLLKKLCETLLSEGTQFRPWYELGVVLGECDEQLGSASTIDLTKVFAAVDCLKTHGSDQVRALANLRTLTCGRDATTDAFMTVTKLFPEVDLSTQHGPVAGFFECVLHDVERLDLRHETEVDLRLRAREKWMYVERTRGRSYAEIIRSCKSEFPDLDQGRPITSASGVKGAVERYAKKNSYHLPRRRRGRRKGT
jgi:hypothetical protein